MRPYDRSPSPRPFSLLSLVADDYVLADLRNRFWGGTGEKPWQVVEINRLLTRRKEGRAGASVDVRRDSQAVKPPSLKERIENNLVVFFLATLLTGFFAGLGAYQGALTLVDYSPISNDALRVLRDDVEKKGATITTLDARVKAAESSVGEQRWLRIRGVEGLDGSRARLVARVNGRAYSYPSRAVWSRLGPGMPVEDFPLPIDTKAYDISFELLTLAPDSQFRQFQSQEVISVRSFESEYKIFAITIEQAGTVRAALPPSTSVRYAAPR
ncbi:MAG: hypothetical protein ACREU9_07610 [Gammaproteobacteria bacterium]